MFIRRIVYVFLSILSTALNEGRIIAHKSIDLFFFRQSPAPFLSIRRIFIFNFLCRFYLAAKTREQVETFQR